MPSFRHQTLIELFRDEPRLALHLMRTHAPSSLPAGAQLAPESAQFTNLPLTEYIADAAYTIRDHNHNPTGAVIVEVQLSKSSHKRASWLAYVAYLHRKLKSKPVTLLALALTDEIAAWCMQSHHYDHIGNHFTPLVIGPDQVPRITDLAQAEQLPALAALSVAAHGHREDAESIAIPAYLACGTLDRDRGAWYSDAILSWLSHKARQVLEEHMSMNDYQCQSEWFRVHAERGRQQGLKEGIKEGIIEGLKEGRKEGLLDGHKQGLLDGREAGLLDGRKEGLIDGRKEGLIDGRKEGLINGIHVLCSALSIPLSESQRAHLAAAEVSRLETILQALGATQRWPAE